MILQHDPLNFKDTKKYTDRIKDAQKNTGQKEAILLSEGDLGGMKTIIACQDFKFMGGSMGMAVGNAILEGVKKAVKIDLLLFYLLLLGVQECKKVFCH